MDEKTLVNLYDQYLSETVKERTIMMTVMDRKDWDFGKQRPTEFKGSFDGFIEWLRLKNK